MGKLKWDNVGERLYETGVSRGVLFVMDPTTNKAKPGVVWNGITAVNESPSGAETTSLYADNIKYLNMLSKEDFGCTIEAYMSPEEFDACDGRKSLTNTSGGITVNQQARQTFAFTYTTQLGNDVLGSDYGEVIHIVYGCTASPSGKNYSTINDSPEAMTLSWEVKTTPIDVPGMKPTAKIDIDSKKTNAATYQAIKDYLYGRDAVEASQGVEAVTALTSRLLMPADLITLVNDPETVLDDTPVVGG